MFLDLCNRVLHILILELRIEGNSQVPNKMTELILDDPRVDFFI